MTGRRLAWLVLALLMIAVPGRTSRQDVDHRKNGPPPEILNRIISLDLKNVPLEQALALIARKGRFLLNFNRSRIPVDRIVSVKMTDAAVGDVLETILRDSGAELIVTSGGQLAIVPSSSLTTTSPPRVGTIQGRVCERQTGAPLSGVEIRLAAGRARAVSDGNGRFVLTGLPPGPHSVVFNLPGFEPLTCPDVIVKSSRTTPVEAEMVISPLKIENEMIDVVAKYKSMKNPLSAFTLTENEIVNATETAGGISRLFNAVPGVSFLSDANVDFVVRGGSPLENGFYVDHIEVPGIDHISMMGSNGGFFSSIGPGAVRSIDYITGGFSADYGDRLSSITRIALKDGSRDRVQGQLDMSLAGAGIGLDGPLPGKKASWLFSLRKSYLPLLQIMGLDLDNVPSTIDSQIKLTFDLSSRHRLQFLNFYANGSFKEKDPYSNIRLIAESLHNTMGVHWAADWSHRFHSDTSLSLTFHRRHDGESIGVIRPTGRIWEAFDSARTVILRNDNFLSLNKSHQLDFGFRLKTESEDMDFLIHLPIETYYDPPGLPSRRGIRYGTTKTGLFSSYILTPIPGVSATIGLRGDYSSAHRRFHLSPRASLSYRITDRINVHGGWGIYYQTLPLNFLAYVPGAVDLKDMKADHSILGVEYLSRGGTRLSFEAYLKRYENLPISPETPLYLATDIFLDRSLDNTYGPLGSRLPVSLTSAGRADSRGVEFLIQQKLVSNFSILLSASFFRSRYRDLTGVLRNRIFDNRFVINLMGYWKPSSSWELSGRLIILGGGPYTPPDQMRSHQADRWILDTNRFLHSRYPDYYRLNIRLSKRFNLEGARLEAYLDLWNVFDQENLLGYTWNRHGGGMDQDHQMGTVPILGLRIDF